MDSGERIRLPLNAYIARMRAWSLVAAVLSVIALLCAIAEAGAARADTLDWNTRPATNLRTGGTDAAVINGVTVTTSGAPSGAFDGAGPNTLAIEPATTSNGTTGYINSTMNATVDDESAYHLVTITFSEPVYNVSLVVGDIDGGPTFNQSGSAFNDIVEFRANGGAVLPTSGTPVNATKVTWTAASGRASANNFSVTDNSGDVTVTFAGPITSLTIRHIAGANSTVTNPTQQFTYVETLTYTRSPRITLTKISNGGVGTFNFTGSNGFGADAIATVVAGAGVAGATKVLSVASTATTLTEAIPSGYLVTAATCSGLGAGTTTPNLVAGTILLDAAATAPGANIACTYTNGKRPTVQVTKVSNGAVGAFSFSGDNGFGADTVTTAVSGTPVNGVVKTLTTAGAVTTLTETIPAGYVVTAITCSGLGAGTATPNLGAGTVVLNAAATAATNNVLCSFTNRKVPTVKVQKITTGGVGGAFTFAQTNLASSPAGITTVAVGIATPASPTAINVTTVGTAVTLTETSPATFAIGSASCTDANSAITGNSGSIGTLTGNVLTIPPAKVVSGADFTCTFTNQKTPTVKVQKITTGGIGGAFTFAQTNLASAPAGITTVAVGTATPASPTAINVTTVGTAVTLTESSPATFAVASASCTDANSAITGNSGTIGSLAGNILTIPAANVVAGADFSCVFTNRKIPTVKVQKITTGGIGGSFTFSQTNLASAPASITTVAVGTATPASPTAINVTTVSTAVTLTETSPAAFAVASASCTDANSAITGNSGSIGSLAGNALTIPAANVVAGADFTCIFTNRKIPTVKVQKITTGAVGGPFTFAQTNLASAPTGITTVAVNTATPVSPAAINVSAVGTAVTLTETVAATFMVTSATCTDANSAVTGNSGSIGTLVGNVLTIPAVSVVAGADFTCVFSNVKLIPAMTVVKSSSTPGPVNVGTVITYTYKVTNTGNTTITNVSVGESFNGNGTPPAPANETLTADAAPLGDSSNGTANDGIWAVLGPGDEVTFTAPYTVTQADLDLLQ